MRSVERLNQADYHIGIVTLSTRHEDFQLHIIVSLLRNGVDPFRVLTRSTTRLDVAISLGPNRVETVLASEAVVSVGVVDVLVAVVNVLEGVGWGVSVFNNT